RLACVQCTKSAQSGDLFRDIMATGRAIAKCGPALFQPDIPQNTGTILRHQAGGMTRPAVGVPVCTQSAF
ncbi:MAG TPA: hypothetical protein VGO01_13915, partial [Bradyrhizobium sp.]|nr:hypothetical protein [Bradyrhizobium sp.]